MCMKNLTLSDRLAMRRKALGLTQQQVADAVGRSGVSVYKWESGQNEPKGQNLIALARVLKCSATWLLFGDEDQSPLPVEELPTELDERQKLLLELFDSLPESEKERQIIELTNKVNDFNRLFDELLTARKNKKTSK
ncbi:helix-turn-helix domain-containing protein [Salmonella enterica]|nr:helix-turn-helix domain-containing protein [Salmonella enterica]EKR1462553.1 helix-turn-helix domain-containing protein [Salmonella enterica subsp. salamae serovar 47:b:1,5]EFU2799971.1 helix-turn-helix domain-containing protein [Salmonella enterica]EHM5436427.1 helix-turn-helix domain-containing protein [Salmonella enterica]EHN6271587.1 helix-turn-helix domain-containing protein [Salmonella enterica]